MDIQEFTMWIAEFGLNPFPDVRLENQLASISSFFANVMCQKSATTPKDFIQKYDLGTPEQQAERERILREVAMMTLLEEQKRRNT